jgi:DNA-binding transcriptional regulator of glucitol operon
MGSSPVIGGSGRVTAGSTRPRLTGCPGEIIGREEAGNMTFVRKRWLSRRAVSLHLAVLVFVPACAVAAWWQIHRAEDGNQLSYLYSVMWPVFGILGLYFWWMLLHTDYEAVGLKGMRRQQEAAAADNGRTVAVAPAAPEEPAPILTVEDPELAAYNARLAELASKGPKTWRAREKVVVRREQ